MRLFAYITGVAMKHAAGIITGVLVLIMTTFNESSGQDKNGDFPYKNPALPVEKRVDDLLARMTLAEKIAQLQCSIVAPKDWNSAGPPKTGNLGSMLRGFSPRESAKRMNAIQKDVFENTRLGIPVLMHDEALHGLMAKKSTSFPQAISLASTWNPALMSRVAAAIAEETKSRGIRQALSPTINIARDVRWGRVEETYGEDPYLTAQMAVAFCKEFEQRGIVTTPKHYVANIGDGGRDSNPVHFSERLLREIYFPAFKACIQQAGSRSIMSAYNSLDGIPCSAHSWLLNTVLRKEWGFTGFVVSDYGSIGGMIDLHKTAGTFEEAAEQAIRGGMDMELPNPYVFKDGIKTALDKELLTGAAVDTAVKRVLRVKFELGLFDDPYTDPQQAETVNDSPEHRALAREAARQGIVLLKNRNNMLPLPKTVKTLAVIGPLADEVRLGGYSGFGIKTVSVLEGIENIAGDNVSVLYEKGCDLERGGLPAILPEFLRTPEGKKGLKGEYFTNRDLKGIPALVRTDPRIDFDWKGGSPEESLPADGYSVRWTGTIVAPEMAEYKISITTDDGVRLWFDGKLKVDQWLDRGPTADIITVNLEKGKEYPIRIDYYENGGGAFAALGWKYSDEPPAGIKKAAESVARADAAVLVLGVPEGEGRDRADIRLPRQEKQLIDAITILNKPVTVVLMCGSAVEMQSWYNNVDAVVQAWYAGEEGGSAVAEVLFGQYNPAGRLPITWPKSVAQLPLYYNYKPSGRGYDYLDIDDKPKFAFGYGLSYTKFEYANMTLRENNKGGYPSLSVTVDVKNSGKMAGDEVVQLYLHDVIASVARPLRELKGFERITLQPGETKTVTFKLGPEHFRFLNAEMDYMIEPGTVEIMIGAASDDIRIQLDYKITKGVIHRQ